MGSLQAQDIQNFASLDVSLAWHLSGNHYPPIPSSMIPIAKEAIEKAQEYQFTLDQDLLDYRIELPDGVSFRGSTAAPVRDIMEGLHLWDFVQAEDEDYDPDLEDF